MNKECLRCALSIYLSYLILWLFVGIVINPADSGELTKYFLSDVFGKNLYIDHQRWYYLMEGTIRFFFRSLCICVFRDYDCIYVQEKG